MSSSRPWFRRALALLALAASASGTGAYVAHGRAPSQGVNLLFLALSFVGYAVVVLAMRKDVRVLPVMLIAGVIVALVVEAVALSPRNSYDLWAYASYGRIAVHYHDNPYAADPASYRGDPFVERLAPEWEHSRTVYGPAFTGLSALVMALARSPLAARVWFQSLAGLAMLGALVLVWRHTRDPAAIAFIGLHPVLAVSIVNGGHNDALLGLAVVGGLLLITRKRYTYGGVVLALAAMVKIVGLFALAAAVWWIWRRRGRPGALRAGLAGAATFLAGYAVVGYRAAFTAMSETARYLTRFSLARRVFPDVAQNSDAAARVVQLWFVVVVVVGAALVVRYARGHDLFVTATAPLVAYLLLAAYVLPWYVAWSLPALGLRRTTMPARLVAAAAGALILVYWPIRGQYPGDGWFVSATFAAVIAPLISAAGVVILIWDSRRPPRAVLGLPAAAESNARPVADTIA